MADIPLTTWARLADIMRRRRMLIVAVAAFALVVLDGFILGLPPMYRATTTLLVTHLSLEGLVHQTVSEQVSARLQTIKHQALSRARLTELIERFDPYGVKDGRSTVPGAIERFLQDIRVLPMSTDETPSGRLQTIAFTVSYVGPDPRTTAAVTNALASFFVAQNDRLRTQQASEATSVLSAQAADARAQLQAHEGRVRSYTSRNIGTLPQQMDANLAAIGRLDGQLRVNNEEQLNLLERRQMLLTEMATLAARRPAIEDTSAEARLRRLELDLVDMRNRGYTDSYPDVRATQAQIEQLREQIAGGRGRAGDARALTPRSTIQQSVDEIDAQLKRLEDENKSLKDRIASYERRVESAPAYQPELEGLVGEYAAMRDRYETLQRRVDEARLAERAERNPESQEFSILDSALPPGQPTGPARWLLLVVGLIGSALFGVAVAFVVDRLDTSFHSIDDLRAFTRVPVLAAIPEMPDRREQRRRRYRAIVAAGASIVALAALGQGAYLFASSSDRVARVLSHVS
jgi:polysaccharide chain length determinant protein (PEP-CTERM system associated)